MLGGGLVGMVVFCALCALRFALLCFAPERATRKCRIKHAVLNLRDASQSRERKAPEACSNDDEYILTIT